MFTIMRKYMKVPRTFPVYTEEEAREKGISYVPWEQSQVGGWGSTTDGYVMECLRHIPMKNGVIIEFSGGRTITKSKKFEFLPRYQMKDWWGLSPGWWQRREAAKSRTKNAVKVYVQMVLAGKVDFGLVGQVYRPDQAIPEATVRKLFRQEEIKQMITKEMEEVLAKEGLTKQFVIQKMKKALEIAETKLDPANMLRAAESMSDMLEMKPRTQSPQFGLPSSPMGELPAYEAVMAELALPPTEPDDD